MQMSGCKTQLYMMQTVLESGSEKTPYCMHEMFNKMSKGLERAGGDGKSLEGNLQQ